jgi:hypothetical protein
MDIPQWVFDHDLYLFNLGDVHRGDHCCNVPLFHKVVKAIRDNDKAAWVSTGDLLNVALKTSVSDSYKSDPLGVEFKKLKAELKPIAHKCLGIVGSNHHKRFEKSVGMNLDELICESLRIPYLGISNVINITLGRASYYTAMHHGVGGGVLRGGKTTNLERLDTIYPGCDIYLEGHTHTYASFCNLIQYVDKKRDKITQYKAWYCCAAHFLDWKKSYGEEKKYRPMPPGAAFLHLKHCGAGNQKNKKVTPYFYD